MSDMPVLSDLAQKIRETLHLKPVLTASMINTSTSVEAEYLKEALHTLVAANIACIFSSRQPREVYYLTEYAGWLETSPCLQTDTLLKPDTENLDYLGGRVVTTLWHKPILTPSMINTATSVRTEELRKTLYTLVDRGLVQNVGQRSVRHQKFSDIFYLTEYEPWLKNTPCLADTSISRREALAQQGGGDFE